MTRLSSSRADLDKLWRPLMQCPKCGNLTTATNVCRQCPETPADQELNPDMIRVNLPCRYEGCYGEVHWVERDGKKYPAGHGYVKMEYTGVVEESFALAMKRTGRAGTIAQRREYKPKDGGEAQSLWSGTGVVFNE